MWPKQTRRLPELFLNLGIDKISVFCKHCAWGRTNKVSKVCNCIFTAGDVIIVSLLFMYNFTHLLLIRSFHELQYQLSPCPQFAGALVHMDPTVYAPHTCPSVKRCCLNSNMQRHTWLLKKMGRDTGLGYQATTGYHLRSTLSPLKEHNMCVC